MQYKTNAVDSLYNRIMWMRRNKNARTLLVILGVALFLGAVGLVSYQVSNKVHRAERLLTDVMAAKALFIEGINPYSSAAVQLRDVYAQVSAVPEARQVTFNNPLYSLFLDLPFLLIEDFSAIRTIWFAISLIGVIYLVMLSRSITGWRSHPIVVLGSVLFGVLWSQFALTTLIGMKTIITALLVCGFFNAVKERHYEWAGVLLGLTSIQPYITIALGLYVFIWSIRERHFQIIIWQWITLLLLYGLGALIRPQWLVDYLRVLFTPSTELFTLSRLVGDILPAAGVRVSIIISVIAGFILLMEWFIGPRKSFDRFLWTGSLTLALTPLLGGLTEPSSYLVLILGISLALKLLNERWPFKGNIFSILFILIFLVGGWLLLYPNIDQRLIHLHGYFFFAPILTAIMLYWVRWWAMDKPRVWYDSALSDKIKLN